ncbi:MAG: hypothetical protein A2189_05755 [Paenibacillus sp. RIFOXYA1_FULL_44_5]|nr:MAG: hypothetical protein A2189_05755 [Paenibacillus sp. RIFOXYA1_FULL_44_5]
MPIAYINGTHLHYDIKGDGVPIIFIHPPLLTSANFRYQQVQLSSNFQIITFDIRGHGQSAASKEVLTYPLIVEDIRQLMNMLGIKKAYLCGYSTGASIVLEALLTNPDRFFGGILVSGMSEVHNSILKLRLVLAAFFSRQKWSRKLLSYVITSGNADIKQSYRNMYSSAIKGSFQNISQYYEYSLRYNATNRLAHILQPVLVMYGSLDRNFAKHANRMSSKIPHAEEFVVAGMKHQIPTKAASIMNNKIRKWINSQVPDDPNESIWPHDAGEDQQVEQARQ